MTDLSSNKQEADPADQPVVTAAPASARPFEEAETIIDFSRAPVSARVVNLDAISPTTTVPNSADFEVLGQIAEGGHGFVWEAVQKSLNRQVALKSLKSTQSVFPTSDGDTTELSPMESLFKQEAMTAAHLEHPNIVPIHDLAFDEQGRPTLAMKLVRGRQWNDILAEDFARMSVRQFLARHVQVLISVGNAVAFAHSRNIIHRDLKPPQVMIGRFGEVLLMDWGLAMAFIGHDGTTYDSSIISDPSSPLINPINPAGTPGYMAPEQAVHDLHGLGPWTDVYLLGAILYEMLTGFRPHRTEGLSDITEAARRNVIIRPEERTPDRDIPPQLSALAMRAMQTRHTDRPASALEFVSELQGYLGRVDLRNDSMAIVTKVARNILAMPHSYETLQDCLDRLNHALSLWSENQLAAQMRYGVIIAFAREACRNRDIKLARLLAERVHKCRERQSLLDDIAILEDDINTQERRTQEALDQAKSDRNRAESLIRFLLGDLHTELRSIGRLDLIYRVTEESLQFFDSLSEREADEETLHNRAIAYMYIGDVLSEQGRRTEADNAFTKAGEICRYLTVLNPQDARWQSALADCTDRLGRLYHFMGRRAEAVEAYNKAIGLREALRGHGEPMPDDERALANSRHDLAILQWRNADFEVAERNVLDALDTARRLVRNRPSEVRYQSDLALFLGAWSNILRDQGRINEAVKAVYDSLAIRIGLQDQEPHNVSRNEDVLWTRSNLALLLLQRGDLEESLETFKRDLPQRRRLYEDGPNHVVRLNGLTFQLSFISQILFLMENVSEAEAIMRECLHLSRLLVDRDPSNPSALATHSRHLSMLAEILISQDRWDESREHVRTALERSRHSTWMDPENIGVIRAYAFALLLQGRLYQFDERTKEVARIQEEVAELGILEGYDKQDLEARRELLMGPSEAARSCLRSLLSKRRLSPYLKNWARGLGVTTSVNGAG